MAQTCLKVVGVSQCRQVSPPSACRLCISRIIEGLDSPFDSMAIFTIACTTVVPPLVCWETFWRCAIYKRSERFRQEGNGSANQNRSAKKSNVADEDE
jgi:hypothetical protein